MKEFYLSEKFTEEEIEALYLEIGYCVDRLKEDYANFMANNVKDVAPFITQEVYLRRIGLLNKALLKLKKG